MTNAVLTLVKLAVVLFVIGLGMTMVNSDRNNWFDVPYSERLSGEQLLVPQVVAEQLASQIPSDKLADPQQIEAVVARTQEALKNGTTDEALTAIVEKVRQRAGEVEAERWGVFGYLVNPKTLAPIDRLVQSNFAPYGVSGIMLGAAIVFFAFIGFDSISTHSEEAINPQRDVPLAILASLAVCTVLYILVSAVITGMEPYHSINTKAAVAAAFRKRAELEQSSLLKWSSAFIATGALAGLTSVLLVTFLSQARIFLAMARDRLLPPSIFAVIHPRWKTPHLSTALTGFVICLVAAFTPISELEKMVNIGTLFAFVVVCGTVLVLRVQRPDMHRPFRCPWPMVVAPAGILVNFTMMLFLPAITWVRLFVWLAIGLVLYFSYGYWHSTLGAHLSEQLAKEGVGPTSTPL
ncbi:MAG: amino acid permease [Planctomycetota bacterium]|nr:amino acid permease [Planctomycetota bacterium]MDA1180718.1 amino acid permease [Planctomycetota bacterium]